MKWHVKGCFLLSGILLVFTVFSYFYKATSMDFLQIINYPLRLYTLPLLILGFLILFLSVMLHKISQ